MHDIDDIELVKQAQAGSVAAVGELYDRHHGKIFRYLRFKSGDYQTAQDLTAELFLRMVKHIHTFEPRGVPFTAWLYRIATHLAINQGQQQAKLPLVALGAAESLSHNSHNPVVAIEKQQEAEWLWQGLETLQESQREVLILRFVSGLSLKETADVLEKTVAAVKTLQHRGILALQVVLVNEKKVSSHE